MSADVVNTVYAYPFESDLAATDGGPRLCLATSGGRESHPHFFDGRLRRPVESAALLLAVAKVAGTRFYVPPAMVERILREADPVVTSDGAWLRFESFSQCCGVYARADLPASWLDGIFHGRGTTNVDFNAPMRAALAQIGADESVGLQIGSDLVTLNRASGSVTERKVRLPQRWLKGFVETQAYARTLSPVHHITGPEARRFLMSLPAQVKARDSAFVVAAGKGLRVSRQDAPQAVAVGGIGRLHAFRPLARHLQSLQVYGSPSRSSGWSFKIGDARLEVILSPEAARGFSGEGQVLDDLVAGATGSAVARVRALLAWQQRLSPDELAAKAETDPACVANALGQLGSQGLVGYDIHSGAYFHREMPFDLSAVDGLHPRLAKARRIVEAGQVRISSSDDPVEALVRGSGVEHRVSIAAGKGRCTCPWFSKHQGDAGPCAHILALRLAIDNAETAGR